MSRTDRATRYHPKQKASGDGAITNPSRHRDGAITNPIRQHTVSPIRSLCYLICAEKVQNRKCLYFSICTKKNLIIVERFVSVSGAIIGVSRVLGMMVIRKFKLQAFGHFSQLTFKPTITRLHSLKTAIPRSPKTATAMMHVVNTRKNLVHQAS